VALIPEETLVAECKRQKAVLQELTSGERGIAELVARGLTNQEIANELDLRPKTVEWTLTNVYRKLQLRSRTELAVHVLLARHESNPGLSPDD
jgi:LuxR family transcriptional regulator, maltose regulon positive regulatory protein